MNTRKIKVKGLLQLKPKNLKLLKRVIANTIYNYHSTLELKRMLNVQLDSAGREIKSWNVSASDPISWEIFNKEVFTPGDVFLQLKHYSEDCGYLLADIVCTNVDDKKEKLEYDSYYPIVLGNHHSNIMDYEYSNVIEDEEILDDLLTLMSMKGIKYNG